MDGGLAQRSHDGIKMICSRATWLTDSKMFIVSGQGLAVSGMDRTGTLFTAPLTCFSLPLFRTGIYLVLSWTKAGG